MVYEAARGAFGVARAARPWGTLAVIADLRRRSGGRHLDPTTQMTMTEESVALIERVERQADGDLVREMPAFAAARIMEAEVDRKSVV
mgnify:FL=1